MSVASPSPQAHPPSHTFPDPSKALPSSIGFQVTPDQIPTVGIQATPLPSKTYIYSFAIDPNDPDSATLTIGPFFDGVEPKALEETEWKKIVEPYRQQYQSMKKSISAKNVAKIQFHEGKCYILQQKDLLLYPGNNWIRKMDPATRNTHSSIITEDVEKLMDTVKNNSAINIDLTHVGTGYVRPMSANMLREDSDLITKEISFYELDSTGYGPMHELPQDQPLQPHHKRYNELVKTAQQWRQQGRYKKALIPLFNLTPDTEHKPFVTVSAAPDKDRNADRSYLHSPFRFRSSAPKLDVHVRKRKDMTPPDATRVVYIDRDALLTTSAPSADQLEMLSCPPMWMAYRNHLGHANEANPDFRYDSGEEKTYLIRVKSLKKDDSVPLPLHCGQVDSPPRNEGSPLRTPSRIPLDVENRRGSLFSTVPFEEDDPLEIQQIDPQSHSLSMLVQSRRLEDKIPDIVTEEVMGQLVVDSCREYQIALIRNKAEGQNSTHIIDSICSEELENRAESGDSHAKEQIRIACIIRHIAALYSLPEGNAYTLDTFKESSQAAHIAKKSIEEVNQAIIKLTRLYPRLTPMQLIHYLLTGEHASSLPTSIDGSVNQVQECALAQFGLTRVN